jgi:hypothetical protein
MRYGLQLITFNYTAIANYCPTALGVHFRFASLVALNSCGYDSPKLKRTHSMSLLTNAELFSKVQKKE